MLTLKVVSIFIGKAFLTGVFLMTGFTAAGFVWGRLGFMRTLYLKDKPRFYWHVINTYGIPLNLGSELNTWTQEKEDAINNA